MQEGIDDSVNNLFDNPADDGHLAAEHEALEEAELEQRENLQEESAGALADLSLSSKTSQELGTESATETRQLREVQIRVSLNLNSEMFLLVKWNVSDVIEVLLYFLG